jgi:hypothetical protein
MGYRTRAHLETREKIPARRAVNFSLDSERPRGVRPRAPHAALDVGARVTLASGSSPRDR